MVRRLFLLAGALMLAIVALGFAMGSASAQEPNGGLAPNDTPACPPDQTCVDQPPPACENGVVCYGDPVDCPPGEVCAEPVPCPPDSDVCVGNEDSDGDGTFDFEEGAFGSDPHDPSSTPEHPYFTGTCTDGLDNDGDGAVDLDDEPCNLDSDHDNLIDVHDNCPLDENIDQADADNDGIGNVCDFDADNDNWEDFNEVHAGSDPNDASSTPEHTVFTDTCADGVDNDRDGATDAADSGCAPDGDVDFVSDTNDNCPTAWNDDQADADGDGIGDACEDADGDGFFDVDEEGWGTDPNDPTSTPEFVFFEATCHDGIDNDGDGAIDDADGGCSSVILEAAPGVYDDKGRDVAVPPSVVPISLPAAGSGAESASDDNAALLVALAATAATAGAGLVLAGRRLARRNVSH